MVRDTVKALAGFVIALGAAIIVTGVQGPEITVAAIEVGGELVLVGFLVFVGGVALLRDYVRE